MNWRIYAIVGLVIAIFLYVKSKGFTNKNNGSGDGTQGAQNINPLDPNQFANLLNGASYQQGQIGSAPDGNIPEWIPVDQWSNAYLFYSEFQHWPVSMAELTNFIQGKYGSNSWFYTNKPS